MSNSEKPDLVYTYDESPERGVFLTGIVLPNGCKVHCSSYLQTLPSNSPILDSLETL